MSRLQEILPWQLSSEELFFVFLAFTFFAIGLLMVIFIFLSRLFKGSRRLRESGVRKRFQEVLNAIIIQELQFQDDESSPIKDFRLDELRKLIGLSSFRAQICINQIRELKRNLTGSSAQSLCKLYRNLELHKASLRKIKSFSWRKKALGIRELAELECDDFITSIQPFLHSKNKILREESFIALAKLNRGNPLSFLDSYQGKITDWIKINIYHHLASIERNRIPDFSQWFKHSNPSVSLFSMSMALQFRQLHSAPTLAELLKSDYPEILKFALKSLGEMDAYQFSDKVAAIENRISHDDQLLIIFLRTLARIGDPENHKPIVQRYLEHGSTEIQFEAVSTLKKLSLSDQEFRSLIQSKNNDQLTSMIGHVSEPLLQS